MKHTKPLNLSVHVALIYPVTESPGKETPDTIFFSAYSYLKDKTSNCRRIIANIRDEPVKLTHELNLSDQNINLIYFHIRGITLLPIISSFIPNLKKHPGSNLLIAVGGHPSISVCAPQIIAAYPLIDMTIIYSRLGQTLSALIEQLKKGLNWRETAGISCLTQSPNNLPGKIRVNDPPAHRQNQLYADNLAIFRAGQADKFPWYPILISFGCANTCKYCVNHRIFSNNISPAQTTDETIDAPTQTFDTDAPGLRENPRPPSQQEKGPLPLRHKKVSEIIAEIEFLTAHGINTFIFSCDQFFLPRLSPEYSLKKLFETIIRKKIKITFRFITKPAELRNNLSLLPLLRKAGLAEISIGIDSGLERFHKMFATGSSVADIFTVLNELRQLRIAFDIIYIFFDPYLSIAEIRESIVFLENIAPFFFHLELPYPAILDSRVLCSVLQLRAGIPIMDDLRRDNLLVETHDFSAHPSAVFKDPEVNLFYIIYRHINQGSLKKTRHLFYNKHIISAHPSLNLFPLRIMEKILQVIAEVNGQNLEDYLNPVSTFIENALFPLLPV